MKYVKLVAKPDTWFKEGTEAYEYDSHWDTKRRITLEEWERDWVMTNSVLARGIRVKQYDTESGSICMGEEYFDGEACSIEEFEVTIVDEPV